MNGGWIMGTVNKFDFTIAVAPKTMSIEQDMQYIKSALLYSDSITLISPMASAYYMLTDSSHQKNENSVVNLIYKVLPFCEAADPVTCGNFRSALNEFKNILSNKSYKHLPLKQTLPIKTALKNFCKELINVLHVNLDEHQCNDLTSLIKDGKVKLYNFQHTLDDIDGCTNEFYSQIKKSVEHQNTFPLFDKQSNDLINAAVSEDLIVLNETNKFNASHAGLTNNLLVALPSFEYASVSEIVDIRKHLKNPLIRFRSKMLSYNDEIQKMPWDKEFDQECSRLYAKEIAPQVLEIQEMTQDANFLKNLGYKMIGDDSIYKAAGGLIVSIAAAGTVAAFSDVISADHAALATGGTFVVSKITQAYLDYTKTQKAIQRKDMFFYYKAGKTLNKQNNHPV